MIGTHPLSVEYNLRDCVTAKSSLQNRRFTWNENYVKTVANSLTVFPAGGKVFRVFCLQQGILFVSGVSNRIDIYTLNFISIQPQQGEILCWYCLDIDKKQNYATKV